MNKRTNERNKLWLILTLQMAADLGRIREALVRRVEAVIRSVHQLGSDLFLVHASDGILLAFFGPNKQVLHYNSHQHARGCLHLVSSSLSSAREVRS